MWSPYTKVTLLIQVFVIRVTECKSSSRTLFINEVYVRRNEVY